MVKSLTSSLQIQVMVTFHHLDITITGSGKFAKLTPILENGRLSKIIIVGPGVDYVNGETFLTITNPGVDALVEAEINEWNVNLFTRNFDAVGEDDGFVEENLVMILHNIVTSTHQDPLENRHMFSQRMVRLSMVFLILKNLVVLKLLVDSTHLFLVGHMMEIQSMVPMDTQIGQVVLSNN